MLERMDLRAGTCILLSSEHLKYFVLAGVNLEASSSAAAAGAGCCSLTCANKPNRRLGPFEKIR